MLVQENGIITKKLNCHIKYRYNLGRHSPPLMHADTEKKCIATNKLSPTDPADERAQKIVDLIDRIT